MLFTFFILLEPIGSAPPMVQSKKINLLDLEQSSSMALICPAQGSPIPAFRLAFFFVIYKQIITFLEPIGKAAPKFTSDLTSQAFFREKGSTTALICAAQGSPIPSTRFHFDYYFFGTG